jgi:hypothetical protein
METQMEDMNQGAGVDATQDTSAGGDVTQGAEAVDTNEAVSTGGEGEGGADASAEEPQNEEIVEQDGKQFIPYERFKKINDRLKKAEEAANYLESIKSDPTKRQEFVEALGLDKPANAQPNEAPQPAPFQKWMKESVDPQYHGHYEGMAKAFASEMEEYINSLVAPLQQALGALKLKEVETKIPDFGQHEKAVVELMRKHPTLDIETAYKIAAFDQRFKQGQATGIQKAKQQQVKMTKTPISKNPGSAAVSAGEKPKNIHEAMERAWKKANGPNE